jgi:hypothetical protein
MVVSIATASIVVAVLAVALVPSLQTSARHPNTTPAGPSIPAAFVGWTPAPTKTTAARIATYAKRCMWAAQHKSRLGPPLIADVRGPYVALVFVDERDNYQRFCIYGPHLGLQGSGQLTSPLPFDGPPPRDGIQHNGMGGTCDPATGRAVGEMQGQVGGDVTGATFLFPNHARVQASVRRGFYLVWWPWANRPEAITLYTTQGTRHVELSGARRSNWC